MFNFKKLTVTTLLSVTALFSTAAFADDDYLAYQANQYGKIISPDQAHDIAQKHLNAQFISDVDFDYSHRHGAHYEVEAIDSKGREYNVIIDAKTGKVITSYRDY